MKQGFTLIEVLIVVAIIAILAAIAIPNYLAAQIRSKVSQAESDLRTMAIALEAYRTDHNRYPLEPDDIVCILATPYAITSPVAYITEFPLDPFQTPKKPYKYGICKMAKPDGWLAWSIGADQTDDQGNIIYDPSNGIISPGDILREGP